MESHQQIIELLQRIEANQLKALEAQQQQLSFAKAQLERNERVTSESIALQRTSVARQKEVRNIALPLILLLLVLLGYLMIKWRVF